MKFARGYPGKTLAANVGPSLCDSSRMNEESAQATAMRGRRDDWRTQTDSNAVVPRFSRRAATLNVPTPLVEGAHGRSCRFVCVAFRPSPFLAILRRARSVHRDAPRRDASPLSFSRPVSSSRRFFLPDIDACLLFAVSSRRVKDAASRRNAKQG